MGGGEGEERGGGGGREGGIRLIALSNNEGIQCSKLREPLC